MKRNIILASVITLFYIGLYLLSNYIPIINQSPPAADVYMHNKDKKLRLIEKYHKKIKDDYIFSAMMADDKNDLNDTKLPINNSIK